MIANRSGGTSANAGNAEPLLVDSVHIYRIVTAYRNRYLNAGRGPGDFYNDILPIHRGYVDALPGGTSAVDVTADLQGRETLESPGGHPLRLLGEVLPGMLRADVLPYHDLPAGEIGVFLAGDFFTMPALDKRGGSGDVRAVWDAFGLFSS